MKTMLPLLCLLLGGEGVQAQNLVPNPSFEEYIECPTGYGPYEGMDRALDWHTTLGGPELFNICDQGDTAGVPVNCFSYQMPASGVGYMGMWAFGNCECPSGLHEIVGARLTDPLVMGQTYWASLKVSWTTGYPNLDCFPGLASNNVGLLCRMDSVAQGFGNGGWGDFPNHAHVNSTTIITDSVGWTTVAGSFMADSAYRFLYVGNFYGDDQTQFVVMNAAGDQVAYYYVDDICLSPTPGYCPEAVGLQEYDGLFQPVATWLGMSNSILIHDLPSGETYALDLYELTGRLVARENVTATSDPTPWVVRDQPMSQGIFILRIRGGPGEWSMKLPAFDQ